jgi:FKBP-type peptidyl-prolyl cis-trans isomerase FkpA
MHPRLLAVAIAALTLAACGRSENTAEPAATQPAAANTAANTSTSIDPATPAPTQENQAMALQKIELKPGTGPAIAKGQAAVVHYTGWLFDAGAPENKGKKFDSSLDRAEPFEFDLGAGHVIRGWDDGVEGMQVGGQRRLVIPPEMGYGARGAGGGLIPPGATLVFDVELVEIR